MLSHRTATSRALWPVSVARLAALAAAAAGLSAAPAAHAQDALLVIRAEGLRLSGAETNLVFIKARENGTVVNIPPGHPRINNRWTIEIREAVPKGIASRPRRYFFTVLVPNVIVGQSLFLTPAGPALCYQGGLTRIQDYARSNDKTPGQSTTNLMAIQDLRAKCLEAGLLDQVAAPLKEAECRIYMHTKHAIPWLVPPKPLPANLPGCKTWGT
jgi:hypothetical protein